MATVGDRTEESAWLAGRAAALAVEGKDKELAEFVSTLLDDPLTLGQIVVALAWHGTKEARNAQRLGMTALPEDGDQATRFTRTEDCD
jgi:hypothetical protein